MSLALLWIFLSSLGYSKDEMMSFPQLQAMQNFKTHNSGSTESSGAALTPPLSLGHVAGSPVSLLH